MDKNVLVNVEANLTNSKIDMDHSLASRRYRREPPRHFGVQLIRKLADAFESFVASRSIHKDVAVYENNLFPWAARVESQWRGIREELNALMSRREAMPNFQEILPKAGSITQDSRWKTFFLLAPGMDCKKNRRQCPKTVAALSEIPEVQTAFFSILSPGKHLPAHRGAFNGVLRYHLALMVPKPAEQCRIRIGAKTFTWREGKSLIFDDTYNHEVWNDTDHYRVVLFVDFMRPMRSPHDRWMKALLKATARTPWLKEAGGKQKLWEKKFYQQSRRKGKA